MQSNLGRFTAFDLNVSPTVIFLNSVSVFKFFLEVFFCVVVLYVRFEFE